MLKFHRSLSFIILSHWAIIHWSSKQQMVWLAKEHYSNIDQELMTVGYSPRTTKVNRKFLPEATASFCLKTVRVFFVSLCYHLFKSSLLYPKTFIINRNVLGVNAFIYAIFFSLSLSHLLFPTVYWFLKLIIPILLLIFQHDFIMRI